MATSERMPVGQLALHAMFNLAVPLPAVTSYVAASARRTEITGTGVTETYRPTYRPEETAIGHLGFALRYEPLDMGVIAATMRAIDGDSIAAWMRAEPAGAYSRRAWFLYETFSGRLLDVEPRRAVRYADALNAEKQVTGDGRPSSRHRVNDNLLGVAGMCLTVRRTPRILVAIASDVAKEGRLITADYDAATLARAVTYLYTKETRSSFEIEGERPNANRTERFIAALRRALTFDPSDKDALVALQGLIVDPRYAATDWRQTQNFVGETLAGYREKVHFVCPKPGDVAALMADWMAMTRRLVEGTADPVVAATLAAFAFVFIHPFDDGNGRIHRFLLHHVLARRGFSPPGVIFPISAAILRERHLYDAALEAYSGAIAPFIDYTLGTNHEMVVSNATAHLYRYYDATGLAEYLYDRVIDTVRHDLPLELGYVATYDRALAWTREVVDMPDRQASLFVQLCMGNGGRLSKRKRSLFAELSDTEVRAMEAIVGEAMREADRSM